MVDQATMNGAAANGRPKVQLGEDLSGLGHDLLTLAELQAQLLASDAGESARRATVPIAAVVASMLLGIAALPVALIGGATLLAERTSIGLGTWLTTFAATALVAAALGVWLAVKSARLVLEPLQRSQAELAENLRWLKSTLGKSRPEEARMRL